MAAKRATRPIFPNRLRELRRAAGMTIAQLAGEVGKSVPSVHRRELGDVRLKVDELERYASALGLDEPDEILNVKRQLPILARVGAGAEIFPIAEFAPGEGLGEVACPSNLEPDRTAAVIVEGDSMFPLESGWVLFYSRYPDPAADDVVGHLCIVKLADDGPTLVKQVRRGPERGRFNLLSSNAPLIENVKLEWAARVTGMQPPHDQRRRVRS